MFTSDEKKHLMNCFIVCKDTFIYRCLYTSVISEKYYCYYMQKSVFEIATFQPLNIVQVNDPLYTSSTPFLLCACWCFGPIKDLYSKISNPWSNSLSIYFLDLYILTYITTNQYIWEKYPSRFEEENKNFFSGSFYHFIFF